MEKNKILRRSFSCKEDSVQDLISLQKDVYEKTGVYFSQSRIIVECLKNPDKKKIVTSLQNKKNT